MLVEIWYKFEWKKLGEIKMKSNFHYIWYLLLPWVLHTSVQYLLQMQLFSFIVSTDVSITVSRLDEQLREHFLIDRRYKLYEAHIVLNEKY